MQKRRGNKGEHTAISWHESVDETEEAFENGPGRQASAARCFAGSLRQRGYAVARGHAEEDEGSVSSLEDGLQATQTGQNCDWECAESSN